MRVFWCFAVLVMTLSGVIARESVLAQQPARTVADGLYSDMQATRGASSYEAACARCHRTDLGGADGPALREDRFNRTFAGKPLRDLFQRMTATMPRGAPASLAEDVYLDILAHLLRENGFPAGAGELRADALIGVEVLPTRPKPLPAVADFSYVEVAGCLSQSRDGEWTLEQASDPVAVKPPIPGAPAPPLAATRRGGQTFQLLDAVAYAPERHRGQLLNLRGTLIKLAGQQRLTISSVQTLAATCEPPM